MKCATLLYNIFISHSVIYVNMQSSSTRPSTGFFDGTDHFTLHEFPLCNIIKHCMHLHCYADDTQLYLSTKPDDTNQVVKLQACLDTCPLVHIPFSFISTKSKISSLNMMLKNYFLHLFLLG